MDFLIAEEIRSILLQVIKEPKCELDFYNNYQLLIAVVLSAQTTDKKVNSISKLLFLTYPDFISLANANRIELKKIIMPIGLSDVKSRNLIEIAKKVNSNFNGKTPNDFESLTSLNGVGRKTANVVLALGFNVPTFPVDRHVLRVAYRLNFISSKIDTIKAEEELRRNYQKDYWIETHHLFLLFGRYYCKAKNPECEMCPLKKYCIFYANVN